MIPAEQGVLVIHFYQESGIQLPTSNEEKRVEVHLQSCVEFMEWSIHQVTRQRQVVSKARMISTCAIISQILTARRPRFNNSMGNGYSEARNPHGEAEKAIYPADGDSLKSRARHRDLRWVRRQLRLIGHLLSFPPTLSSLVLELES